VDQSWGAAQLSGVPHQVSSAPLAESASTVVAHEGLTQVVFHLPSSVSVEKGRTLSLPIIDGAAPIERLAFYQPDVSATHPLSTLKLTNDGATGLPPGIVTIYEQQADGIAFVGDSRLSDLPRGDFRLLSYALDSKMTIERNEDQTSRLERGAIAKGVLRTETLLSRKTIFHVKSTEKRPLLVETAKLDEWTLAEPSGDGVSEANGQYRIPLQVEAADGQTFTVTQQRSEIQTLTLTDADDATVGYYIKAPEIDPKTRDQLARLADLRAKLADAKQALATIDAQVTAIGNDGSRVRNLLMVVTSDKDLQKRYLVKLDAEETQIETLTASRADAEKARADAQAALEAYIGGL
jgi:hypothetical protein